KSGGKRQQADPANLPDSSASGIYSSLETSGIYRSDDLGETWFGLLDSILYYQTYVRPGGEVDISDIDRLSNGHLFATVNRAYGVDYSPHSIDSFLRSVDDGQTWHEEYPLHENFDPWEIMEVQDDPGHLYLFSQWDRPFYYYKLYESKDYGLSFHPVPAPYFNEFRDCASMSQNPFSGIEYVCTTGNGTWKSEDNGDTWQELRQPPFSTMGYQHINPDFVSYVNRGGTCVYLQRNSDPEVLEIHYPNPSVDYAQANLPIVSVRGDTLIGMYIREVYETETNILITVESPDLGETWGDPITIIPMEQLAHNMRPEYLHSEGDKYVSVTSYNGEASFIFLLNDRGEYTDTYTYETYGCDISIADGYLYLFDHDEVKRIPLGGNQWEDLNYPYYQEGNGSPGLVSEEFEEIYTFGGIHGYRYLNDQWQMLSVVPYGGIQSVAAIPRHGQEPILLLTTNNNPEVYISTDGGWEWDPIPNEVPWFAHSAANGEIIYDPWRECIWVETAHGLVWEGEEWFNDVAEQAASHPESFGLMHAWPNPFNASTNVTIRLTRPGDVTLTLYNSLGQEVQTVLDKQLNAGEHQVTVDADGYASGTYFLRLVTPEGASVRKLSLVR
ncbi:T9SS type A sorting domain-containing protein, partial [bacterium]|nr:T9SS type A sorting domain-containing protein [bacterium]